MIIGNSRAELMQSGLNLIGQAISIFDSDLRLAVANSQFQTLLGLPDNLTVRVYRLPRAPLRALFRTLHTRSDIGCESKRDKPCHIPDML